MKYNRNHYFAKLVKKRGETITSLYEKTKIQRNELVLIKNGKLYPTRAQAVKLGLVLYEIPTKLFPRMRD